MDAAVTTSRRSFRDKTRKANCAHALSSRNRRSQGVERNSFLRVLRREEVTFSRCAEV